MWQEIDEQTSKKQTWKTLKDVIYILKYINVDRKFLSSKELQFKESPKDTRVETNFVLGIHIS